MKKEIIYKYTSYKDALKIIENNSIVVNNPLNYNDPFDCIIDFDAQDEKKTIEALREVYVALEVLYTEHPDKFLFFNKMHAPIKRIQSRYRYQVLMRLAESSILAEVYEICAQARSRDALVTVEENPVVNFRRAFPEAMMRVAEEKRVPCLDLNSHMLAAIRAIEATEGYEYLVSTYYSESTKENGVQVPDKTHQREAGARWVASMIANLLRDSDCTLREYLK